jgi:hypothetical protein
MTIEKRVINKDVEKIEKPGSLRPEPLRIDDKDILPKERRRRNATSTNQDNSF